MCLEKQDYAEICRKIVPVYWKRKTISDGIVHANTLFFIWVQSKIFLYWREENVKSYVFPFHNLTVKLIFPRCVCIYISTKHQQLRKLKKITAFWYHCGIKLPLMNLMEIYEHTDSILETRQAIPISTIEGEILITLD